MLGELYLPKGLALETAQQVLQKQHPMACNIALGCSNNCLYCYGATYKRYGLRMGEIRNPKDTPLHLIEKQFDLKHLKPEAVFLSFFTDPFLKQNYQATEELIGFLIDKDIRVATLSKVNTSMFSYKIRNGMTIVSYSDKFSEQYEPNAIPISQRFQMLKTLADLGDYTWASVEPYPPPWMFPQHLDELLKMFLDIGIKFLIFGKLNYHKSHSGDRKFYKETIHEFRQFCSTHGIRYHIKKDTLKFINREQ